MSSQHAKPDPQPASCEDVDEAHGTTLPGTKVSASANTKVKRSSKESLDDETAVAGGTSGSSVAGDSGYSSQAATVASSGPDERGDYRRERQVAKRADSTRKKTDDTRRSESGSDRRRSLSQAPERSKSKSRRDPEAYYQSNNEPSRMEKAARRHSREIPLRESRATTSQPQARPRLERSHSTSNRPRPVSADFSRLAIPHGGYQYPPSAYPGHGPYFISPPSPQPQYSVGPPPVVTRVAQVPYTINVAAFEQHRPQPHPPLRRQTVNYGRPVLHVSQTPTAIPVQYSTTPIHDASVPAHSFTTESYESALRRDRAAEAKRLKKALEARREEERKIEEARQREARKLEKARRADEHRIAEARALKAEAARRAEAKAAKRDKPSPTRRPSVSRYSGATDAHQPRSKESSRRGSGDPPSPTQMRPPSRQSASYSGNSNRRHSSAAPLTRHPTVDGHENGHDLDRKVHAAESYLRNTDTKPRMDLTPESIKAAKPSRVPSNASSHRSRSSKNSGHKTSSSRSNGGITLLTDEFQININDPKDNRFSFKSSDRGVLLTVGDEGKKGTKTMLISKDNESGRSKDGRSVASGVSRQSSHSKRSDRSKR